MASLHTHRGLDYPIQIIALWSVFLFGTIFHTQLALIPLFHGLDVLAPHGHVATDISEITSVLWWMLLFFVLPMIAIMATCFFQSRRYRLIHFWMTVIYSALNIAHLAVDLTIPPIAWYQIALMALLVVVGLVLNVVAYQWVKQLHPHRHMLSA